MFIDAFFSLSLSLSLSLGFHYLYTEVATDVEWETKDAARREALRNKVAPKKEESSISIFSSNFFGSNDPEPEKEKKEEDEDIPVRFAFDPQYVLIHIIYIIYVVCIYVSMSVIMSIICIYGR